MIDLQYLPEELLIKIFSHLEVEYLCLLNFVSKQFYRISNDDLLWRDLCRPFIEYGNIENNNWKEKYLEIIKFYCKCIGCELDGNKIRSCKRYGKCYRLVKYITFVKILDLLNTNIPCKYIKGLTHINELYLRHCIIPEEHPGYADLKELINLRTLSICNCSLNNLSLEFGELNKLETLSLSFNNFTNMPQCISKLENLKILAMAYNSLSKIPDFNLKNLNSLNLEHNSIKYIPENFKYLENLKELNLNSNPSIEIKNLPKNLIKLYISNSNLSLFPQCIIELTNIEEIYIRKNNLNSLPIELERLKKLRKIDLSANDFRIFPDVLTKIIGLTKINICKNSIKEIPRDIYNLEKLKYLIISPSDSKNIPDENKRQIIIYLE
jgi:hypothetical protein